MGKWINLGGSRQFGLSGKQLQFKLYVYEHFKENDMKVKLLGAINTILGSLCGIFRADPIKEFKGFLELCNKNFENDSECKYPIEEKYK